MVRTVRHRQSKEAATDMPDLPPPRHIPTLPIARRCGSPEAVFHNTSPEAKLIIVKRARCLARHFREEQFDGFDTFACC